MTTNDVGSCEWLVNEITLAHLVERDALDPVAAAFQAENPYADATALAEHLVKTGLLTAFQATRLLEGEGRGLVLGPYVLADVVGAGSLGTMYKALGRADRRAYAVKVLPVRSSWNVRQARKRMQQFPEEPHPGVVPWLDIGTSAGLHYLVWPFAEGETLNDAVRRDGLLPPARAAAIGVQLAQALQWCERNGFWHGAIKPSNVMLGPDGRARLLDLGVGVLLAGAEGGSLVDTLAESSALTALLDCTAPECVTDPGQRSVRSDQYGLGCTLYYGLTGRYPFAGETAAEKVLAHQRQEPTPVAILNPGVPPALATAIDRLLQKAPEGRYNHTDELIAALTPLARQSAVYVPPEVPSFLTAGNPPTTQSRPTASLLTAVTPWPSTRSGAVTPLPRSSRSSMLQPPPPVSPPTPGGHAPADAAPAPAVAGTEPTPATRPAYGPVSLTPPAADGLPATPRPTRTIRERVVRALTFWKSRADPVACTLLTPSGLLPGETTTVQVVLHHSSRSEQAKTLPDWRGTQPLPDPLERGEAVGLHLALQDVGLPKPTGQIDWHGFSAAATFTVRVPEDWPPGQPVQGTLTVGRDRMPVGRLEFALPVAAPQTVVQ